MGRFDEKYQQWRNTFAEQEASGLSGAAFCREHQIQYWKFMDWKKRLRKAESNGSGEFIALEVEESENHGCGIEVVAGHGLRLVLDHGFDEGELLRAVRVLRKSGC